MSDIIKRDQFGNLSPKSMRQLELGSHSKPDGIDIHRIVERLARRKYQILLVFLIVLIPAAIATHLTTPLYRSAALIQINTDPVQILPYRDVVDAVVTGSNLENYMTTQEQILNGPTLRERIAARLEADYKNDPAYAEVSLLHERFTVRKIERSQLFELSYLAPTPEVSATVVNLFAEEYGKQNFQMKQNLREKAEQDLQEELKALEGRLQVSEQELIGYARRNDIVSIEQGQVDPMQQKLAALTQQVADSEAQVTIARSSLSGAQSASITDFPQRLVTEQIGALDARLFQLEQELSTLRSSFGENWPTVIEKRNEMTLIREQLTREKAAVLARHVEQAQMDMRTAEVKHGMLATSFAEQKALVNQFHNASIQYNILKREVETNRNLYDGMLERLRQTGVLAGFQFGNIQVVEVGRPSQGVYSPNVVWNLGLAGGFGLALGMCLVIFLDFWDKSISSLKDAEELALPSLGTVPLIKESKRAEARSLKGRGASSSSSILLRDTAEGTVPPAVSVFTQGASSLPFQASESIKAVCASILLSRSDQRPRIIVVTSATPAEGKTTLVGHLGKAFADAGLSTLLVEGDLRKPDLSKAFSAGSEDGLSLYLAGHVATAPKVHVTEIPNLSVTAAGPTPPNPAALLHSDRLTSFLKAAASQYQIVIVDAPPMLGVADARVLGIQADGVVLVVRAGRTDRNLVQRAWSLLEGSGANVLGMVLNGAEPDQADLSYYRYYQAASKA